LSTCSGTGPWARCGCASTGTTTSRASPLLQAPTDVHTEAEFDQRQEEFEQAARAEEKRREKAEKLKLRAEWALRWGCSWIPRLA
jgi:hypothetical protein